MRKYIMSFDQGTTSSRTLIFDETGKIVAIAQKDFPQIYPQNMHHSYTQNLAIYGSDFKNSQDSIITKSKIESKNTPQDSTHLAKSSQIWVEQDPHSIFSTQIATMSEALAQAGLSAKNIAALGIANQRETTIIWERDTTQPIYNAIVWQDKRMADYSQNLRHTHAKLIQEKTGLVIDSYFCATKIKWILDNVKGARERAERGELCFGTVDSWLVWNLTLDLESTQGSTQNLHITDVSNASRTMLFNIHTLKWDDELLEIFDIPRAILPQVRGSSEIYGYTSRRWGDAPIPIASMIGDQQSALFGQLCTKAGMMKCTYGTGCFMLMNAGDKIAKTQNLLSTIAWQIQGKVTYALEGSVFIGGAAVQWLRDGLKIIREAREINALAESESSNGGVYFVPALSGFGAPHWDEYARGAIFGITQATTAGHIARAVLEGIAFQVSEIVEIMRQEILGDKVLGCEALSGCEMRVDGGASASDYLMQIEADLCGMQIKRPKILESTALGAGYLAGLAVGYFKSVEQIQDLWHIDRIFTPSMDKSEVEDMFRFWKKATQRVLGWAME